jgi:ABC-2 type transport system permease protein
MLFGSLFMNQIIVEKSSKIYEVILTSIDIKEFFIAKYLSFILKILLQTILLIVSFIIPLIFLFPLFFTNIQPSIDSNQTGDIEVALDFYFEILQIFTPVNVGITLLFAILGVIFYTALMSLIGSSYNNYMEASNSGLSWFLTGPIVIPLIFNSWIIDNPNSFVSWFLELFPLTSPVAFAGYVFTDFSWLKVVLALIILIFSIVFSFKIAIKVYLEGVLSDGNIDLKKLTKIIFSGSN